jgi:hypothetical protein
LLACSKTFLRIAVSSAAQERSCESATCSAAQELSCESAIYSAAQELSCESAIYSAAQELSCEVATCSYAQELSCESAICSAAQELSCESATCSAAQELLTFLKPEDSLPLLKEPIPVQNKLLYVSDININIERFEVFTAVTMKNGVFWDVTPCGSYKN